MMKKIEILVVLICLVLACGPLSSVREGQAPPVPSTVSEEVEGPATTKAVKSEQLSPAPQATPTQPQTSSVAKPTAGWTPPSTAADWLSNPVQGAVIEIGYGGPDEYNDPPIHLSKTCGNCGNSAHGWSNLNFSTPGPLSHLIKQMRLSLPG